MLGQDDYHKIKMCIKFEIYKVIMNTKFNNNLREHSYLMLVCFCITDKHFLNIMLSKIVSQSDHLTPSLEGKMITYYSNHYSKQRTDKITNKQKRSRKIIKYTAHEITPSCHTL